MSDHKSDKNRARVARYASRHRAAGLCAHCPRPRATSAHLCEAHLAKHREYKRLRTVKARMARAAVRIAVPACAVGCAS